MLLDYERHRLSTPYCNIHICINSYLHTNMNLCKPIVKDYVSSNLNINNAYSNNSIIDSLAAINDAIILSHTRGAS